MTTQAFLLQPYSLLTSIMTSFIRIFQSSCEVFSTRRYGTCSVHPTVQQPARLERAIVSGGLRVRLRRDLDDRRCGCPLPAQGANSLLWFYALGAGLIDAISHFVFSILKGGYFPRLYTATGAPLVERGGHLPAGHRIAAGPDQGDA
jgi:hypothetical protein